MVTSCAKRKRMLMVSLGTGGNNGFPSIAAERLMVVDPMRCGVLVDLLAGQVR